MEGNVFEKTMNYFQPPQGYKGDQFQEEMQYKSRFYE
jgi:hypothetical protein